MSDENLKEEVQRATGKAYGTGTNASDIVSVLEAQLERWQTVEQSE